MLRSLLVAMVGCCITMVSAEAAPVIYSGSGTFSQALGRLPLTGTVPIGSAFDFSITFDPAKAVLAEASDGYAIYDLALSSASITLGSYAFPLASEPAYTPFIELYRAFSIFPGSTISEETLAFTFFLTGKPTAGDATEPFGGSPGKVQTVAFGGVLRQTNDGRPLTLDNILGAEPTYYTEFEYGTRDSILRQSGILRGTYAGGFASGVPEPDQWALLIAGMGIGGLALRRHTRRKQRQGVARAST